jgi:hypothetical protein
MFRFEKAGCLFRKMGRQRESLARKWIRQFFLEAVETQQLEGELRDRAEALAWIKKKYPLGEA